MSQYAFNSGYAYAISNQSANPTPNQLGVLQSASIDLKSSNKKLYGQGIYPVACGRSQVDVSVKLKFAQYRSRLVADVLGVTQATGQLLVQANESGMIPASSPYTVSTANHMTFTADLGVIYAATGIPLAAVASSPTTGQYSVSAGVYTFAAADDGLGVIVSYSYTQSSGGETLTLANIDAGAANGMKVVTSVRYGGLQTNATLNYCVSDDLKLLDTKIGDFSMPELGYDAICDASGTLGILSFAEVS